METPLERFKKIIAAAQAADAGLLCEHCGATMTGVELPNGKIRAWIDHTPNCPEMPYAGVFILYDV